jgi:hypothetical protein
LVKFIENKATFQAPGEVFDGTRFKRMPFINEVGEPLLGFNGGRCFEDVVRVLADFGFALGFGFGFSQGL